MSFTKRWFALVFALLLGVVVSPAARASADETSVGNSALEVQTPEPTMSVDYRELVSFQPSMDAELRSDPLPADTLPDDSLPSDPGADMQEPAQAAAPETTPAAPATTPAAASTTPKQDPLAQGRQTKRILFVIPNFRAVSADQHLPPQSVKDKFKTAALDSVDYSSFIFVGAQAGVAQANNSYREFGQGAAGYGRYYWHTLADEINENLWVEFIVPSLLHQDTRYYTLGKGPFVKRLGYAFSRVAITRSDSGHQTFNFSEFLGAGAFSATANLYYPSQERTVTKTYQRYITNLAIDSCIFAFKEVWPDINNAIFHQKD